jgi:phage protein D
MATDYRAPGFAVAVNGHMLARDVTDQIVAVSYEHTLDMASKVAVTICNVNQQFTDTNVLAPGNALDVFMGYGTDLRFIGRGEIVRHLPRFPADDVPTLDVVAYDRTHRMMGKELRLDSGKAGTPHHKTGTSGESGTLHTGTVAAVVARLLAKYEIALDLPAGARPWDKVLTGGLQKKGTTDYAFLRAVCNLHGLELSVRWQPGGTPKGTAASALAAVSSGSWRAYMAPANQYVQARKYTLVYAQGSTGTLLSADLDFGMPQMPTEIQVWVFDRRKADWDLVTVRDARAQPGKSERFNPGQGKGGALGRKATAGDKLTAITNATRIKLAVDGHSVEVVADRKFRSKADAAAWGEAWFQRHKDGFVLAKCETVGIEDLAAGQTHTLQGLGVRYSGDYLLSSVLHRFDGDGGYRCQFAGRKVIE